MSDPGAIEAPSEPDAAEPAGLTGAGEVELGVLPGLEVQATTAITERTMARRRRSMPM